jgi:prepilin-type N-terminal cleavage/methylation domain-containing protein
MKNLPNSKGFTLIELLIVMAVVAILAVGVLIGINPIEQINKSKDSSSAQMASQLFSALERYYVNYREYPWDSGGAGLALYRYDYALLGIVDIGGVNTDGVLITSGELKPSFRLRAISTANLYGGRYTSVNNYTVCYIPKSKTARNGIIESNTYLGFSYRMLTNLEWLAVSSMSVPTSENCDENHEWIDNSIQNDTVCVLCIFSE